MSHRRRLGLVPTLGIVLAALAASVYARSAPAADPKPLAIGATAPDFDLPGVHGLNHKLAEYAGSKALVVIFTRKHICTTIYTKVH